MKATTEWQREVVVIFLIKKKKVVNIKLMHVQVTKAAFQVNSIDRLYIKRTIASSILSGA